MGPGEELEHPVKNSLALAPLAVALSLASSLLLGCDGAPEAGPSGSEKLPGDWGVRTEGGASFSTVLRCVERVGDWSMLLKRAP